jgi:hypothetical protein
VLRDGEAEEHSFAAAARPQLGAWGERRRRKNALEESRMRQGIGKKPAAWMIRAARKKTPDGA